MLRWDQTTLAAWKRAGVTVAPAGAAAAAADGAEMQMPITSGYVESHTDHSFKPGAVIGSVDHHESGMTISTSGGSVEATNLVFDLGESTVYATIGGTDDVPLFGLKQAHRKVSRSGRRTLTIGGSVLVLSPTGATVLDSLFRTSAITANTEIGALGMSVTGRLSHYTYDEQTVEYPRLSGIAFSLSFGARALAAFRKEGVTPGAVGSAGYNSASARISLPITGGTAVVHPGRDGKPSGIGGVVLGWGNGFALHGTSTSLTLTDLVYVPAISAVYGSVNDGPDDALLFLLKRAKTSGPRISLAGGNLTLRGEQFDLTSGAAKLFDTEFHATGYEKGYSLGTFTLVASGG